MKLFGVAMAGGGANGWAGIAGAGKRLVENRADSARTSAALRAATEATIDLDGFPRARIARDGVANLGFGKYVARADDHGHFLARRLE
jgi:hypothetical protein